MNILGINFGHPDAAAILLKEGEWLAGSEEERFKRVKHWEGFPSESVLFCMNSTNISFEQLDFIAVAGDVRSNFFRKILFLWQHPNHLKKTKKVFGGFSKEWDRHFPDWLLADKLRFVEHHRAHLASAFYSSPFEEAMIYSVDGSGDFSTSMWGIGKGNKIKIMGNTCFPHSLGLFYTAVSQYLGFHEVGDEYKVMGLAAYGKPVFFDDILKMFQLKKDGTFTLNALYFEWDNPLVKENNANGYPGIPLFYTALWASKWGIPKILGEETSSFNADFAASTQKVFEYILMNRLNYLAEKCDTRNLCLAGGSMQNSVAMGKIKEFTPYRNIYIPCASNDAGLSLGAAQWVHFQRENRRRKEPIYHSFKGISYDEDEIKAICIQEKLIFQEHSMEEIIQKVVSILMSGGVIGWFQGSAEFGPRALGNRSILANPSVPDIRDKLNGVIKNREKFRPFALSVLADCQQDFIGCDDFLPFMEQVIIPEGKALNQIESLLHIDQSVRIQSVRKEDNDLFYQLIRSFYKTSGIPALINTSFNENEPIINSPLEAIRCFQRTQLDYLIMGKILIKK
ncbi:MAG: carbamoyltransferase [Bacteroidota bacterium]